MERMLVWVFALAVFAAPASAEEPWDSLRKGGAVVVMRHAQTVAGVGDPPGFQVEACATQRNLSEEGRAQARAVGRRFAENGVAVTEILSSRWCRCLETARLAFGRAQAWPMLDSLFGDRAARRAEQTEAVRARISAWRGPGTLALVTHQVNITALTGRPTASGEILVLRPAPDGFTVVGRLPPP